MRRQVLQVMYPSQTQYRRNVIAVKQTPAGIFNFEFRIYERHLPAKNDTKASYNPRRRQNVDLRCSRLSEHPRGLSKRRARREHVVDQQPTPFFYSMGLRDLECASHVLHPLSF